MLKRMQDSGVASLQISISIGIKRKMHRLISKAQDLFVAALP